MDDAERLHTERQKLRAEYRDLYTNVLEILFRVDPIGLNFEDNTDEYEPEVGSILPRLRGAKSLPDVQQILKEELEYWFGASISDRFPERTHRAAEEIWRAWQRFLRA
jgi:hypothetical protein